MKISLKNSMKFFLIACLFFSCRVSWVPGYSAALEDQISKAAKANDKLYLDMMDVPNNERRYQKYQQQYNDIESEINSIQLKNEARKNNKNFLAVIENLKNAFVEAKNYHKQKDTITNGEVKSYQATMAAYWRPLYFAERGLKDPKATQ